MTIFNIYMVSFVKSVAHFGHCANVSQTYGGTNWGNLGQPGGPTSYDYGAAIKEDRTVWREKYSEAKLEAQFFAVSPAYLTANAANSTEPGIVSSTEVVATPIYGNKTNFYVVRQADFRSLAATTYKLMADTSIGPVSIPRMGGSLTLNGRDSKIHVTDYDVGGINLIYSSAEVFTWQKSGSKSVLVLYGGAGETHEFAISSVLGGVTSVEGTGVKHEERNGTTTVNFTVGPARRVVHFGQKLDVYLLWRNDAYNYWVPYTGSATATSNTVGYTKSSLIVAGGYLLRGASVTSSCISLYGDINATTTFEIIAGQPEGKPEILFNDKAVQNVNLPDFAKLEWHYLDSLPEIKPTYDDAKWTLADLPKTYNTAIGSTTPTSLFSSDYGYEAGALLYRGHFTANGAESTFNVTTQGGGGFANPIWLTSPQGGFGSRFLGAYVGSSNPGDNATVTLPALKKGKRYTLTIVIDHMGTEANWTPGLDLLKTPRGILNYTLSGHPASDVFWKITGNLGGEQYRDQARGPLNEGGLYAERQGYHQPHPPTSDHGWKVASPLTGISAAGIAFYTTRFNLNVSHGYDVPMSFVFNQTASSDSIPNSPDYRCQLYVNGYQFGIYINNLGPQTAFPIPQGILNYQGENTVALTLWALEAKGAHVGSFALQANDVVQSIGYFDSNSAIYPAQPVWQKRQDAY
ncbi:hypothetical protein LTR56_025015 [Elasticomyces elasticus]|nr:hypothetical protein LTR56_025015 [Elasticomyces elasticus]KAK3645803.1 hypothetical protein LTR22_014571 [Elasticomyces elasticus]KAK4906620.1 hypothetical protein LTR49_024267 [Elasticomyces elasticus]KAK5741560.1 hypothetical protein LTS12_024568 [Elasticomyces elasticus]